MKICGPPPPNPARGEKTAGGSIASGRAVNVLLAPPWCPFRARFTPVSRPVYLPVIPGFSRLSGAILPAAGYVALAFCFLWVSPSVYGPSASDRRRGGLSGVPAAGLLWVCRLGLRCCAALLIPCQAQPFAKPIKAGRLFAVGAMSAMPPRRVPAIVGCLVFHAALPLFPLAGDPCQVARLQASKQGCPLSF